MHPEADAPSDEPLDRTDPDVEVPAAHSSVVPWFAGRHVVLVGLMGVGKSTVGPILAVGMDRSFVDLDAEVERLAGRSVRELVSDGGEPEFRRLEAESLSELLRQPAPLVVATGGGAVLDPASRQLLRDVPVVVWLRASVDTLVARVGGAGAVNRPLLDEGPATALARLSHERDGLYREVADVEVDTTLDDADGVAASVLTALGRVGNAMTGEQPL
jgi:shikimate kinase / 3-dehydroquinate synthase